MRRQQWAAVGGQHGIGRGIGEQAQRPLDFSSPSRIDGSDHVLQTPLSSPQRPMVDSHTPDQSEAALASKQGARSLVCVVIPTCNNASSIAQVVTSIRQQGLPVLVVDDGCSDESPALAREAGAEVISHPRNLGKGCALFTGWRSAQKRGFRHAITVDADGQHLASDLPSFLAAIDREPNTLWAGTRSHNIENVSSAARFGRRFSDFMLWAAAADELAGERPDSQCGLRAYPINSVLALPMRGGRFETEMEVLVKALWHGIPVRALPVEVFYPTRNKRVTHFHTWSDNARIVRVYTRLMLMRLFWPLFRPRKRLPEP